MATENAFDYAANVPETINMFQSLKDSEPTVDHSARWRDKFQPALERIASRAARESQAQECRKIILKNTERTVLALKLIGIPSDVVPDELLHSFVPQLTGQGTLPTRKDLAQAYMFSIVDYGALRIIYHLQFKSKVRLEEFEKPYQTMCEVQADLMAMKSMCSAGWSHARAYQEYALGPLEARLANIKREFEENLYRLSPMPPDSSRFLAFLDKYSKQRDAFQQATATDIDAAYNMGDYATALKDLRPLADQGIARAQFLLGNMYKNAWGVPQNNVEAVKWYRLAANQGILLAQSNLGVMYVGGRGVPQNDEEAARWYRLAADQGEAGAQYNLSNMYLQGQGVPQDPAEAVKWLHLAADQGLADAQHNLGVMYEMGRGVAKNNVAAFMYYTLAAAGLNGEEQIQAI